MTMNFSMSHGANLPGKGRWPGNVYLACAGEEVGLDDMIGRIEQAPAICNDRVAVIVGSQRLGSHAPDALVVFLHGQRLGVALDRNGDFLIIGSAKTERHAPVRVHLGRNHWWLWCLRSTGHGGDECDGKH